MKKAVRHSGGQAFGHAIPRPQAPAFKCGAKLFAGFDEASKSVAQHFNAGTRRSVWLFAITICAVAVSSVQRAAAAETLFKNGTILTVTKGTIDRGDLLIRDGRIVAIGRGLKVPAGARVIDATGKFLMPGILDAHSHLCAEGGLNEMTEIVSAEVDVNDVVNDKDMGIKWALAGGVTTINTMHGSANPIGGITATLKLRWGRSAEEMKFAGARRHIKFALGENPKRVHAERGLTTRLGVAESIRQHLVAAREYQRDWDDYRKKAAAGQQVIPPRKDLKLENLAAVLRGEIWLQCHSYRADEIEMLLKLSDEFGFKVGAMQHVLEGYKVAPEIAARGIGASTFADMWGYKLEAYDGIVHNPAAMAQWGVRTSVNSDSGERIRRLNLDAAKSLRYGGLPEDQCLALVTINAAWQLGVDSKVGSLEVGKDADISVWDAHPLSAYSKCVMTLVDGDIYFERKTDGNATFGIASATPPTPATPATSPTPNSQRPTPSAFFPLAIPTTAAPSEPADLAITDVRIVTVSGPVIDRGTVVIRNGRITAVGANVPVPSGVKVIRAGGQSLYPGFINATGNMGLTEISSVPESQDLGEPGALKAHIRAADAFHTQSAWVGVARCAGVTSALVSPRGSGWAGWSALMHTAGRTVEHSTVVGELGQALSLTGGFGPVAGGEGGLSQSSGPAAPTGEALRTSVPKALAEAKAYAKQWDDHRAKNDTSARPPKTDLFMQALAPVARGERPAFVTASSKEEIEAAVKFGKENKTQIVVTGGRDADKAAEALNKAGVPVIFTEVWNMNGLTDAYDRNYTAPRRLFEQGVKFCIATTDVVNLAQTAGAAAAYGLPRDEALKAITLYPAQILGVEKDLGSIEVGKIADLLLTDGDPLEYRTKIRKMFVNGIDTPLISKHSQLYEEYRKRK